MSVDHLQRLKYRLVELPVWIGIPILGVFSVNKPILLTKFLIFLSGIFCIVAFILILNDWGGYKKILSRKSFDWTHQSLLYFSLLAIVASFAIGLVLLPWTKVVFLCMVGVVLNLLYSHPIFHLKESIIGSKLLHLLGGIFLFLLGFIVFSGQIYRGVLLSVFFALIFTSGHFIHEGIDYQEDKNQNIKTCATKYGIYRSWQFGLLFFYVSHGYLMLIYFLKIIEPKNFFLFMLPLLVHIYVILKEKYCGFEQLRLEGYRSMYRYSYTVVALFYICFNVKKIIY